MKRDSKMKFNLDIHVAVASRPFLVLDLFISYFGVIQKKLIYLIKLIELVWPTE